MHFNTRKCRMRVYWSSASMLSDKIKRRKKWSRWRHTCMMIHDLWLIYWLSRSTVFKSCPILQIDRRQSNLSCMCARDRWDNSLQSGKEYHKSNLLVRRKTSQVCLSNCTLARSEMHLTDGKANRVRSWSSIKLRWLKTTRIRMISWRKQVDIKKPRSSRKFNTVEI